jgi:hypothetical protein
MCEEQYNEIPYSSKHCADFLEELYFIDRRRLFMKCLFPYMDTSTIENITVDQYRSHSSDGISEDKRIEIEKMFLGQLQNIRLMQRKVYYDSMSEETHDKK